MSHDGGYRRQSDPDGPRGGTGEDDPVRGQWLGMAFVRILVRDHTDGGTGETRMGMADECRDTVRAASIACAVAVRLAETLFALEDVALAWTIREGARMAAVRAHHSFR